MDGLRARKACREGIASRMTMKFLVIYVIEAPTTGTNCDDVGISHIVLETR